MMEAARQAGSNNCGKALKLYTQIIESDPMFIPEIIESVVSCYKQLNNIDELASYLDKLFKKTRHSSVLRARVNLISQQQGNRAALEYLQQQLLENPKLQNLQLLIQLQMASENRFEQDLLPVFSDVINEEISTRAAYSCRRCGFAAKTLHWQCPGCRSWGTIKPAPGQELQSLTA
jgi:lipopolysaccharide biosynthesis regulator YciM